MKPEDATHDHDFLSMSDGDEQPWRDLVDAIAIALIFAGAITGLIVPYSFLGSRLLN